MVNRLSKQAFAEEIRTRLWPLPVAALVASVSLGILLPRVDAAIDRYLAGLRRSADPALVAEEAAAAKAAAKARTLFHIFDAEARRHG